MAKMPFKMTKLKFIEAVENNEEGLTSKELAVQLGISHQYFYKLRKQYRDDIVDAAREMIKGMAAEQVINLSINARKGDTQAAKALLEMTGLHEKERPNRIELVLVSGVKENENNNQDND